MLVTMSRAVSRRLGTPPTVAGAMLEPPAAIETRWRAFAPMMEIIVNGDLTSHWRPAEVNQWKSLYVSTIKGRAQTG